MALEAMRWGIRLKPHEIEQAIRAGILPSKNLKGGCLATADKTNDYAKK